jgi:exosortase
MEKQADIGIVEEFRLEFWDKLSDKGLFFVLLAAWLALFHFFGNSTIGYEPTHSLFRWMYIAYSPGREAAFSDDKHGLIMLFVVPFLFWVRRKELFSVQLRNWWPGLLIVGVGLAIHWIGYVVQQPRISVVALFVGLYGLTGVVWGLDWLKVSFFPFFLFAFCVPIGTLAEAITFPLRLLVCRLVEMISNSVLAIGIIRKGTALIDPSGQYQYDVAVACSGMRSLIAAVAIAVVYAWMSFPKLWKRALLIASAFPLAVLGNLTRMMMIVIASELGGQPAGNYVHEGGPGGIISLSPYILVFGGLLLIGHWLRENPVDSALRLEPQTT